MRTILDPIRYDEPHVAIDEPSHRVGHSAAGNQKRVIVIDRDKASVKHPVDRTRERDAIAYTVWPAIRDRPDVGCLNFRSPTAID